MISRASCSAPSASRPMDAASSAAAGSSAAAASSATRTTRPLRTRPRHNDHAQGPSIRLPPWVGLLALAKARRLSCSC